MKLVLDIDGFMRFKHGCCLILAYVGVLRKELSCIKLFKEFRKISAWWPKIGAWDFVNF